MSILILIIINVIIFVLVNTGSFSAEQLGSSYENSIEEKEYYRLISSGFTHQDISHLLCNMISLTNISGSIINFFGTTKMLLIYFVSMILGSFLSCFIRHKMKQDDLLSIGASGAICGLLGVYYILVLFYGGSDRFSYIIRSFASLVLMSANIRVDGIGHLTGLVIGLVFGLLFIL